MARNRMSGSFHSPLLGLGQDDTGWAVQGFCSIVGVPHLRRFRFRVEKRLLVTSMVLVYNFRE
jgi:hypothetical protein